jgi:hypothetical protein
MRPSRDVSMMKFWATLVDKTFHDSYTAEELPRKTLLLEKTPLGFHLRGEQASLVVLEDAPDDLRCGATGNCPIWIFAHHGAGLNLILESEGWGVAVRHATNHGLHDVAVASHLSGSMTAFNVYRFDGSGYKPLDCYVAHYDGDRVRISGCNEN